MGLGIFVQCVCAALWAVPGGLGEKIEEAASCATREEGEGLSREGTSCLCSWAVPRRSQRRCEKRKTKLCCPWQQGRGAVGPCAATGRAKQKHLSFG
ncbi:hypothetical protein COP2_023043 [Malus domestica]